jgi:hypothetical protein
MLVGCGCGGLGTEPEGGGDTKQASEELDATCLSATTDSGFVTADFDTQTAPFSLELDATPSSGQADALIGLSSGVAGRYKDLAAILRFNGDGSLDARNGGSYSAPFPIAYSAGENHHLRFDVDPAAGVYSVHWLQPNGTTTIGSNFSFRSEQASATSLAHAALKVDGAGELSVCNLRLSSPCANVAAGTRFTNQPIAPEATAFTLSFTVTPSATDIDAVVGVSSGPATAFNDLAAAVRFNADGNIDARNGAGYASYEYEPIPYSAGTSYQILLVVDVLGHSYTAVDVSHDLVIAKNYAFRSEQSAVPSLANVAAIVDGEAGAATVCNIGSARSEDTLYLHDLLRYGSLDLAHLTNAAGLANGQLLVADSESTHLIDERGDLVGSVPHGGGLALDAAENRYYLGTFTGSYDGGGGPISGMGGTDIYLSKYDPSWQHVYSFAFGGVGDDSAYPYVVNAAGELFLRVNDSGLRLDAQGNLLWTRSITGTAFLALDDAGNAFVGQNASDWHSFDVTKLDPNGTEVWTHTAVETSGGATLSEIDAAPDGSVVLHGSIAGWVDFGDGHEFGAMRPDGSMAFLAKYAADGSFVFARSVDIESETFMTLDGEGRITLGGTRFNPDRFFLEQFGPDGSFLRELAGEQLVNGLFLGSGRNALADRAGNVYWAINPRLGGPSFGYFLKIAPP